jgi:hypothetical protein
VRRIRDRDGCAVHELDPVRPSDIRRNNAHMGPRNTSQEVENDMPNEPPAAGLARAIKSRFAEGGRYPSPKKIIKTRQAEKILDEWLHSQKGSAS